MHIVPAMAVLALCVAASAAQAQVRTERNMPLTLALEAAQVAVAECTTKGYNVTATVVDRAGQVKAVVRADGAGPHTVDASRRKAYTSASTRAPTTGMLENIQKNPGAQYLHLIDGFLPLGGGMPIRSGQEVIGAIGVGGAPGGHLDDQCAQAAIAKIQDRLN